MALIRPSLGDLINTAESDINALLPGADSRLRFSMLNVFARVWAALVDGLYSALNFLSRQVFATTSKREYLSQIADSYGIYRLTAQAAQGCVLLTGAAGASVPSGTLLQRADGVQYATSAGIVLPATGFAEVPAIALVLGKLGNAVANVQLSLTSPIAGLASVMVCSAAIGGGSDDETDDGLRARVLNRLRNPPGAGNVHDWEGWALSMSAAVTRVWVVPTVYGFGTVGIVFTQDASSVVPPPAVITQMQNWLAQFTPMGSTVYVFAPTLVPVNFSIHEIPNSDPAIRASIIAELTDLLYREAGPGTTVPLSRINEAISAAEGEYDHALVTPIAAPTFTFTAPVFQIGVLGAVSWV